MEDQDLLDGATSVHQLVEREIAGLETEVAAGTVIAVGVLQHRVTAAAATREIGALDVRHGRRHERGVVETILEDLPDVDQRFPFPVCERGYDRQGPGSRSEQACARLDGSVLLLVALIE